MLKKVHSEDDYLTIRDAYYQYLGHRNMLKQTQLDQLLLKALEVGKPELALELIQNHAELMSHPTPAVIEAFLDHYKQ